MSKFNQYLTEQLKDSSFKAEYDALEAEFAIIQAMITARQKPGMTQSSLLSVPVSTKATSASWSEEMVILPYVP